MQKDLAVYDNDWKLNPFVSQPTDDLNEMLKLLDYIISKMCGGIRGTVVVRWTAGQQVSRSILRQGHDS